MGKYCVNCGRELHTGARFCAKCGAAVLDVPANTAPAAQPGPLPPPQAKAEAQPQSNASPVATAKIKSSKPAKRNGGRSTLCVVLCVLLVVQIAAVALYGWPGFLLRDRPQRLSSTDIVNGVAKLGGMTVDFKAPTYAEKKLKNAEIIPADLEEGAVSAGYEFAFENIPDGIIRLSAPIPKGFTLAENQCLYLDIGFSMLDGEGETIMVYDHVLASKQAEQMVAELTPSAYENIAANVYLDNASYAKPAYNDKMRFNAQFKVKLISTSKSRRFNLIFDSSRLMATTITNDMIQGLLSRMEQVYGQYAAFGFDMSKRTKWPMDVHVTTLKNADATTSTSAQYVSSWLGINHGYVNLSRLLFTNFDLNSASSVFAHELMHFVQECYVSTQYKRLDWLDEATAVFFEKYFGGTGDHSARQYELFDGIYPASDSPRAGYARGGLMAYWASRNGWFEGKDALSGKDKMLGLIDLYSTGGYLQESKWYAWINDRIGKPSKYAVELFTKMLLNEESVWAELALKPYTLHQVIVDNRGKKKNDFSSTLDLEYTVSLFTSEMRLTADAITSEDGQRYDVKVPAYGARVVALTMDGSEQNKIQDDRVYNSSLVISSVNGEELVLLKALSKDTTTQKGAKVSSPKFLKSLFENNRYLLLLVNTTEDEKTMSFTARLDAEKKEAGEDIYSGVYKGTFANKVFGTEKPVTIEVIGIYEDGKWLHTIEYSFEDSEYPVLLWGQLDISGGETGNSTVDISFSADGQSISILFYEYSNGPVKSVITAAK